MVLCVSLLHILTYYYQICFELGLLAGYNDDLVDFLKKAQSQQLSSNSRCHVFDCVSDNVYFEIIVIPEDDEDSYLK